MKRCGLIKEVGHLNHYARAEEIDGIADELADFLEVIRGLPGPICTANSSALLLHRKHLVQADWVRAGLMLYGASPLAGHTGPDLNLWPAMSLHSKIVGIKHLAAGVALGSNEFFSAKQARRIGIVGCGYADGYPRQASTGTPVLVAGVRTHLLDKASMDTLMVDLTSMPEATTGTAVTLWGAPTLPIEEVAAHAGTPMPSVWLAATPT